MSTEPEIEWSEEDPCGLIAVPTTIDGLKKANVHREKHGYRPFLLNEPFSPERLATANEFRARRGLPPLSAEDTVNF